MMATLAIRELQQAYQDAARARNGEAGPLLRRQTEQHKKEIAALRSTIDEDGKQFTAINEEMLALRESLRQREAELEQRWIAVEERLPEEGQHVLIFRPKHPEYRFVNSLTFRDGAFNCVCCNQSVAAQPTHWQPLPSPPKVQL